ncbi:glycosyltransferase family 2 protein [Glaciihabitans sp. dw_435]|uniref:glycosyltransferase family 2 protein n=1 Tax=Glaciihabitans sp. dw_435 TaxID=2720081 RepID=UPI001BD44008|nr:glycosyltransferase family 2 protein [Glaciihabitans sp. dw_435]
MAAELAAGGSEMSIAGVIVTFNTDVPELSSALRLISTSLSELVLADNSDDPDIARDIKELAESMGATYIGLGGNLGIAAAQNSAIRHIRSQGHEYVLFLDDDSKMTADAVWALLAALKEEQRKYPKTIAAGPIILDERANIPLAFVWKSSAIKRLVDVDATAEPIEAAFLLSSGCLIEMTAFEAIGEFRDEYFIDHVDKEWGLRAGLLGYRLIVVPGVVMNHLLADSVEFDSRGIPRHQHQNPIRDYYLTRNGIFILRDLRLPPVRRFRMMLFLGAAYARKMRRKSTTPVQRRIMTAAVLDGLRNRRGPLAPTVK